jgi:hypothetical protein
MSPCAMSDRIEWYRRLMELFERTATREAARELLDELLAAAGDGVGTPPVRIDGGAVLVPAELYDLFVKLLDENDLSGQVEAAVSADYEQQRRKLRSAAAELGLDPSMVAPEADRSTV